MFKEPFIINGRAFTRESLLEYCASVTDGKTTGMTDGKTAEVEDGTSATGDRLEWKKKLYRFINDLLNEDRPIVQQTSGTTGDPKVYELSRTAMLNSAKMTLSCFALKPGNTALLSLPVDYIAGKMMVVRAFEGNLRLVTSEPSGNPLNDFNQPVDFAAMVPLQVFEAMKTPEKLNEYIGTLLIGGGEISENLRKEIRGLDKVRVYETFAMTETLTHFALRRLNGPEADSLFRALEGVTIGSDDRGCLTVSVEGITRGTVLTNDLVRIHAPGAFEWLGRHDNVINTGGIKVIPEMLEAKIRAHTGREILVLGLPDEKLGQKLVMVMESEGEAEGRGNAEGKGDAEGESEAEGRGNAEGKSDAEGEGEGESEAEGKGNAEAEGERTATEKEPLLVQLKTVLAKHEIPREVFFLKEFPRNRSMKIDRKEVQRIIEKLCQE